MALIQLSRLLFENEVLYNSGTFITKMLTVQLFTAGSERNRTFKFFVAMVKFFIWQQKLASLIQLRRLRSEKVPKFGSQKISSFVIKKP